DGVVHRHAPGLAMLRAGHREDAVGEVDVLPPQVELLGTPEARVDRDAHHRPVRRVEDCNKASLLVVGEEPHPGVVLAEEHLGPDGTGGDLLICDRDVVDATEEAQLAVDGGWCDLLPALCDIPLHVARENLRQCPSRERCLPGPAVADVVTEPPEPVLVAAQEVVDHVGQEVVASAQSVREEASLLNLVLPLLVDLRRESLRTDLLAVPPAVFVEVADPPGPRTLRVLVDSAATLAAS